MSKSTNDRPKEFVREPLKDQFNEFICNRIEHALDGELMFTPDLQDVQNKVLELETHLERRLSKKQRVLLKELDEAATEYCSLMMREAYKQGLRDGIELKGTLINVDSKQTVYI